LYNIFLVLYRTGIWFASIVNPKAKQWIRGRKNLFDKIAAEVQGTHPVVWMHCASLGEFEQGRPLLEKISNSYPGYKLLITFFPHRDTRS